MKFSRRKLPEFHTWTEPATKSHGQVIITTIGDSPKMYAGYVKWHRLDDDIVFVTVDPSGKLSRFLTSNESLRMIQVLAARKRYEYTEKLYKELLKWKQSRTSTSRT